MEQKTILTIEQKQFLELFDKEKSLTKKFYFTGGTVLSKFYLQHRYSEDIDLFSESEKEFSTPPIRAFIEKVKKKLRIEKVEYENFLGLHTFWLTFCNKEKLKIDFNYYPFPRIEKGIRYKNIIVDSLYDIAVNKVHTISMQPRARDFIDVYFIVKEKGYSFAQFLMDAKAKFDWHIDPMQLGTQLLKATDVKDYPRMIKKINHKEWQNFFVAEARKLKKKIFM